MFRFQKRLRIVIIKCYQYTPQKKVSECFNVINKSLEMLDENVVYKYTCNVDQSISYIGKASRQKFKRVADNTERKIAVLFSIKWINEHSVKTPTSKLI